MRMTVLGLDLSSRECKKSGYALLSTSFKIIDLGVFHFNSEILQYVATHKPNLVSIDAPLSLSKCGFRNCERMMLRRGFRLYPTNIEWMKKLTERGILIADKIRMLSVKVIETHPTSSLRAAGFKGNYKSNSEVADFLSSKWGINVPSRISRHIIDAIISAIAGIYYLNNRAIIFRADDGEIVLASSHNL